MRQIPEILTPNFPINEAPHLFNPQINQTSHNTNSTYPKPNLISLLQERVREEIKRRWRWAAAAREEYQAEE